MESKSVQNKTTELLSGGKGLFFHACMLICSCTWSCSFMLIPVHSCAVQSCYDLLSLEMEIQNKLY